MALCVSHLASMNESQIHVISDILKPLQPELEESHTKSLRSSEFPIHSQNVAIHVAHTCLSAISQFQLPSNTFRCKRFIQFARSRTRNKEYLDALKTVERLLVLTDVALRNFQRSLDGSGQTGLEYSVEEAHPALSPGLKHRSGDLSDVWDDSDASSTSSEGSWPFTTSTDYSTTSDSEPSTPYLGPMIGDWKWISDLITLLWETLENGKCDSIIDPSRNSWSRFMEARYKDWLEGGDLSLALDHRDVFDLELRHSSFDFTQYVEDLLEPGRRYGTLCAFIGSNASRAEIL